MTSATHANPPKVGIVGHSQAGKSTFLAVLMKAFQERGYQVTDEDPSSRSYPDSLATYVNTGFFPRKTPIHDQDRRRVSLHVTSDRMRRMGTEGFVIDFFDPAGDVFEIAPGAQNAEHAEIRQRIMAQLEGCSGLIVLMDSEASSEMVSQIFRNTVEDMVGRLRRAEDQNRLKNGRLAIPVVILFTKADALRWQQRHRIRDANDWVRLQPKFNELVKDAENYCERVSYGFCSAAGWREGQPNFRTLVRPRPLPGRAFEPGVLFSQTATAQTDDDATNAPNANDEPQDALAAEEARERRAEAERRCAAELQMYLEEDQGEHIPDPALNAEGIHKAASASRDTSAALRFMASLPVFTDPLRLVTAKAMAHPISDVDDRYGVINLYGASMDASRQSGHAAISPWNVAEAVLWAAGFTETGEPIARHRTARKRIREPS
jgi:GTPase SAR1 family protein